MYMPGGRTMKLDREQLPMKREEIDVNAQTVQSII